MKIFSRWFLSLFLLVAFQASPLLIKELHASSTPPVKQESVSERGEPVKADLIAEETSIKPGRPFWVGIHLKIAQGWDTYWVNPGDAGLPTQVKWDLPPGFKTGPMKWPYPERFVSESLVGYGYTNSVLLLTEIIPPSNLDLSHNIEIGAQVSWLACSNTCVPGSAELKLSLPVRSEVPALNETVASQFIQTRNLLPQPLDKKEGAVVAQTVGDKIVIKVMGTAGNFKEVADAVFFPEEGIIDNQVPQTLNKDSKGFSLDLKKAALDQQTPSSIKGVLLVSEKENPYKRAILVDTQVGPASSSMGATELSSFWIALGLAFAGGLILNVMPCVLPVIALKIFSFVKIAKENRKVVFKQGAIFSLGVILSFWVLAGLLFVLRAYGEGVGWGFQLQEPLFVVVLASLLFLLGLSLFGVFEFGTSLISLGQKTQKVSSPTAGSFWSGVLATMVATPCTGPLLGPALGFAMTLPYVLSLAVFTSMALGMAFPYLLFSAFPKLIRFLPKPGNWMIVFKQCMGFLMMATVAWLVWVFGAQTDNMAVFALLISFILLSLGAWIYGHWATPIKKKATRMIATVLTLTLLLGGGGFGIYTAKIHKDFSGNSAKTVQVSNDQGWEAYNPDRVMELRSQGVPVFVDFTAKWCLICQANKVALHSPESEAAFANAHVVKMTADWTKKDPVITQALQNLGRSGVPVYVLYPGNVNDEPIILPQTLTSTVVKDYIARLPAPVQNMVHAE